jgi:hypothetical protein
METPANLPMGPRNLALPVAAWLRRLGFEVQEQQTLVLTLVTARWYDLPRVHGFQFVYTHFHPDWKPHLAYCSLHLHGAGYPPAGQCLLADTHVKRLREVRFLLLSNMRYAAARQAALDAGILLPAHAQPTLILP